jgi:hypothetical protein
VPIFCCNSVSQDKPSHSVPRLNKVCLKNVMFKFLQLKDYQGGICGVPNCYGMFPAELSWRASEDVIRFLAILYKLPVIEAGGFVISPQHKITHAP